MGFPTFFPGWIGWIDLSPIDLPRPRGPQEGHGPRLGLGAEGRHRAAAYRMGTASGGDGLRGRGGLQARAVGPPWASGGPRVAVVGGDLTTGNLSSLW